MSRGEGEDTTLIATGRFSPPLADVTNTRRLTNRSHTTQASATRAEIAEQVPTSSDEREILSLLGERISYDKCLVTSPPNLSPKVPEEFRLEVEQRWAQGRLSDAVAYYYLHKMTSGDSLRAPGQNGRPSLLSAVLNEDIQALARQNEAGFGWQPKRVIGKGASGSVILWEKQSEHGLPLRMAAKDCLCSPFYKDYCAEAQLTRRLNDLGCKNVISVVEWAYIKKPTYRTEGGAVYWTMPKNRICYEFAEHSDLRSLEKWYRSQGLIFPEPFIWHILYSIANTLCYCRHGTNTLPSKVRFNHDSHKVIKR